MSSRFQLAIAKIDEINAADARTEEVDGTEVPKELLYGQRMSRRLDHFEEAPSEALVLAARGQHIGRYQIPRDDYPRTRTGYLTWRTDLYKHHADLTAQVLRDVQYDQGTIDRVRYLIQKKALRRDAETQTLEDVACLVFLEHYATDFEGEQEASKMVSILQKTWIKMSAKAQEVALELALSPRLKDLLSLALSEAQEPKS